MCVIKYLKRVVMYKKLVIISFSLAMALSSLYAEDKDEFGKTELYQAVEKENFELVKELVEDDAAYVNVTADNGYSPLMIACVKGNFEIIKYLIDNGADINYQMEDDSYSLYQLVGYQDLEKDQNYLSMVKYMIEKGADYNMIGFNNYSLIHASKDINITKYLIELGMDIHAVSKNNATTLIGSVANDGKNSLIPKYLIDHCVDLNATATFSDVKVNAYDMALKLNRMESAQVIKAAMKNPPKHCFETKIIAPIVDIHNAPKNIDKNTTKVSIIIRAQGSGIGKSQLFSNGVELFKNDGNISTEDSNIKTYDVNLQKGSNIITAYAYDKSNTLKSKVMTYVITYNPKEIEKIEEIKEINVGKFKLVVNENSIFINIKDKVKNHFSFRNIKGEYKIVLDFDSNIFTRFVNVNTNTPKFNNIKIGYHRSFYRLVIETKDEYEYALKTSKEGIEIILK